MTDDTNGPVPPDPESDDQFAREPSAAEGETWHGGAPEDDFGDDAAAGETATVMEETDQQPDAAAPATAKERSLFVPFAAAVGGILLLGVLAYWQFGDTMHGEQQPAPLVITQAFKPKSVTEKTTSVVPTSETVAPKTDLAPIATETAPPTATPFNIVTSAPSAPAASALPPSAAVAVVPVAVKTDSTATESRLAALSARVEDLQKSLDQATQQLNQISGKLAAGQTAAVSPQASPAIEDRLNGIEQKLMQMQHAAPSVEVTAEGSAPQMAIHPTQHKAVHHKTAKASSASHAKASLAVHWVLRAASPNEAWVAKDYSSEELQPVHVGDTLSGIGLVTAIRDDNGAWVVDGAKGTIR